MQPLIDFLIKQSGVKVGHYGAALHVPRLVCAINMCGIDARAWSCKVKVTIKTHHPGKETDFSITSMSDQVAAIETMGIYRDLQGTQGWDAILNTYIESFKRSASVSKKQHVYFSATSIPTQMRMPPHDQDLQRFLDAASEWQKNMLHQQTPFHDIQPDEMRRL